MDIKTALPRSIVCSEGSVGIPQNMMLVSIVQSNREKQHETRCTRVKLLLGGRLITENQMWPSWKSFVVFMKNRLLLKQITHLYKIMCIYNNLWYLKFLSARLCCMAKNVWACETHSYVRPSLNCRCKVGSAQISRMSLGCRSTISLPMKLRWDPWRHGLPKFVWKNTSDLHKTLTSAALNTSEMNWNDCRTPSLPNQCKDIITAKKPQLNFKCSQFWNV